MYQQLVLGDFIFSLANSTAYEQLVRKSTGGWVNIDMTNAKPRSHNTGQGLETIAISGKVFGAQGEVAIDRLRQLEGTRQPHVVIDGLGRNLGRWKIMEVTETQQRVIDDGTPMVITFDLLLEEFADEDRS